jgi:hypothetical protein
MRRGDAQHTNPDDEPEKRKQRAKALPVVSYWIPGVPDYEIYVTLSASGG